ncbi:MAG TPA: hypothetical protein VF041_09185 [Gemmatimonadaceae bacterium]
MLFPLSRSTSIAAVPAAFTLVETLVAIILLTVGVLALAGTSSAVARLQAETELRERAALLAATRLERLRAAPCPTGTVGGADTDHAIVGRWSAAASGGLLAVEYRARFPDGRGGSLTHTVRSALPC